MDIGIYTIYPMVVLFGMPRKLSASATILSSGADGQGSVIFKYDDMDAVIIYSKIADSQLPTEIQGEKGCIRIDRINQPEEVVYTPHGINTGGLSLNTTQPIVLTAENTNDPYYHEMKEFLDLIETGKRQSDINSHANSLNTMLLLDEIRRQLGIVFPADTISAP